MHRIFLFKGGIGMLVSCSRCGRVHERGECKIKQSSNRRSKPQTVANKFRSTSAWSNKRKEIVTRDKYLCQLCIRGLCDPPPKIYNNETVEVHHITPIMEDYEQRLENENLITLCVYHHKMADHNKIDRKILKQIAEDQQRKNNNI